MYSFSESAQRSPGNIRREVEIRSRPTLSSIQTHTFAPYGSLDSITDWCVSGRRLENLREKPERAENTNRTFSLLVLCKD